MATETAVKRMNTAITKLADEMYSFVDTHPDIIPAAHWYGKYLREAMCVALEEVAKLSCNACAANVSHSAHAPRGRDIRALIADLRKEE